MVKKAGGKKGQKKHPNTGRKKSIAIKYSPSKEALDELDNDESLNDRQKHFCKEYIWDYNASRAAVAAGYSENGAGQTAAKLLRLTKVSDRIKFLKDNVQEATGVTRDRIIREHEKMAFSSIAHMHNTWVDKKDFDKLTADQKDAIAEISTRVRKERAITSSGKMVPVEIEEVKIRLYDKQRSLDSLGKIIGVDAPTRVDLTSGGEVIPPPIINIYNNAPPLAGDEKEIAD